MRGVYNSRRPGRRGLASFAARGLFHLSKVLARAGALCRRATLRAPLKIDTHNAPVRRRAFRAFLQPWKRAGPIELGDPTRTTREANRERSRGHLLPASFSRHTSHNTAPEPHKGRPAPRCLDRAPSATRGAERGEEAHLRNYSCYSGSLNTKKLKYYTHSPLLS